MPAVGVGVGPSHRIASQRGGGGAGFDADALALFAAMTSEPDAARQSLINDTIVALKNAGIWSKLDELWLLAAHDQQAALLGWKRYKDLTAVNAPTFTEDEGFAGDGSTSYLNTNFVPSTDGVNYTLDDASFGVYSRTNQQLTGQDAGARDGLNGARILSRFTDGKYYYRINASTQGLINVPASTGLFVSRRISATTEAPLRNGSVLATSALNSTNFPNLALFLGARNLEGEPDLFSTRQYAAAFAGAAMTAGEQADLFTITESYLDAIGAGVVA